MLKKKYIIGMKYFIHSLNYLLVSFSISQTKLDMLWNERGAKVKNEGLDMIFILFMGFSW